MGRQAEIPGTERKRIEEVDAAAEAYVVQRDKRMKLSEKEKEAKTALIAVMLKHKLDVYKDAEANPPLIVTLSSTDNVKVEQDRKGGGEEEEGDE